jgi:hypothetical protein
MDRPETGLITARNMRGKMVRGAEWVIPKHFRAALMRGRGGTSSEGGPAGCACDSEAIQQSLIGIANGGARGLGRSIADSTKLEKRLAARSNAVWMAR